MIAKWSEARLQSLIDDKVEEGPELEFKGGRAIGRSPDQKFKITRTISALANASGGTVIYGLSEGEGAQKHLAIERTPVERTEFSKEWLAQIVKQIRPRIEGVDIIAVDSDKEPGKVYYVVVVPQSTTAHQALDHRYYKRFNFEAQSMEDYEIRDVMNRQKVPSVKVEIRIEATEGGSGRLRCRVINLSPVFAQHCAVRLRVPTRLPQLLPRFPSLEPERGEDGFAAWELRSDTGVFLGPSALFPHGDRLFDFDFSFDRESESDAPAKEEVSSLPHVWYQAFADGMPPLQRQVELSEVCQYDLPPPATSEWHTIHA